MMPIQSKYLKSSPMDARSCPTASKDCRCVGSNVAPKPSLDIIAAYYESKTDAILRRYGPGPRVHFHTGFTGEPRSNASIVEMRTQLVEAQERVLHYAIEAWRLDSVPFTQVLDVGCGLGGGAIFWAQNLGSKVTAVTIAPSHVRLVQRFAMQAGVGSRVKALLSDATEVPETRRFDAAIAIDSSSSFPREPWFYRLARVLKPGGRVFIFDCFLTNSEYRDPFNHHWRARIGTIEEYLVAARQARFTLEMIEDVSSRAIHFWTTTLALMEAEVLDRSLSKSEESEYEESSQTHALVRQGLYDGGLRHALLSFVLK
jgi:tocopherol O-methyltransferase